MTEHHQPSRRLDTEEKELANNAGGGNSFAGQIAGAVLLGSIILAGSLFYNTKLILKKLDQAPAGGSAPAAAAPSPSQPTQPQAPSGPVDVKDRQDQPTLGGKNASVTIVEFADFQCPFCKQFHDQTFASLKTKYIDTGKVKFIFRHYPLPFHQNAQISAQAAECANRQGKFWDFHEILFAKGTGDGSGLSAADLKKYATDLGLNKGTLGFKKDQFNQCLDGNATLDVVKNDSATGSAAGVSGTPSFVLNGKLIVGAQPLASFEQAIDAALKK